MSEENNIIGDFGTFSREANGACSTIERTDIRGMLGNFRGRTSGGHHGRVAIGGCGIRIVTYLCL
jgi:hypothetical protein